MRENNAKPLLGVLGGMGPLASAEFLRTIYERTLGAREQDAPAVVVYSDPSFPDRTEAFLAGATANVLEQFIFALDRLKAAGASRVVLCCMTIHYVLPMLTPERRRTIISLLDVIFENLGNSPKKHLLICSTGTRKLRLFERHAAWEEFKNCFVMPSDEDQAIIHRDLIYPIKENPDITGQFPLLASLLMKYKVDSFIVGCSEIHLLAKYFTAAEENHREFSCIDPLDLIARQLRREYV